MQIDVAGPTAAPPQARRASPLGGLPSRLTDYGILILVGALFVVLSLASDVFLTKDNLLNILEQNATIGIVAVAGTLVIVAGGFDLSVGAIFAVAGIAAAHATNAADPLLGIVAGVLVGGVLGVGNGLLTTVVRVNPLIATLASAMMIRGLAVLWTGGLVISVSDLGFQTLGTGSLVGVKDSIWVFVLFALLCGVLLQRTAFGRYVYAIGGNEEAARLSGVRVGLVRGATFALSGLAAGIAGVIVASRVGTGQPDGGAGLELTAIAAIVIGGTSIAGGAGAIWRTVVGVFFLALVNNGLNLLNIDPTYQQIVQGAIIVVAVGGDALVRRRRE